MGKKREKSKKRKRKRRKKKKKREKRKKKETTSIAISRVESVTDGRTDRWADGPTVKMACRVVCTLLKRKQTER